MEDSLFIYLKLTYFEALSFWNLYSCWIHRYWSWPLCILPCLPPSPPALPSRRRGHRTWQSLVSYSLGTFSVSADHPPYHGFGSLGIVGSAIQWSRRYFWNWEAWAWKTGCQTLEGSEPFEGQAQCLAPVRLYVLDDWIEGGQGGGRHGQTWGSVGKRHWLSQ